MRKEIIDNIKIFKDCWLISDIAFSTREVALNKDLNFFRMLIQIAGKSDYIHVLEWHITTSKVLNIGSIYLGNNIFALVSRSKDTLFFSSGDMPTSITMKEAIYLVSKEIINMK